MNDIIITLYNGRSVLHVWIQTLQTSDTFSSVETSVFEYLESEEFTDYLLFSKRNVHNFRDYTRSQIKL